MNNQPTLTARLVAQGAKLFVTAAVVVAALSLTDARADDFGSYYADNKYHTYTETALTTNGQTAATWGIQQIGYTDIVPLPEAACIATTDICFEDDDYTLYPQVESSQWWSTRAGKAYCVQNYGSLCEQRRVMFNTDFIDNYGILSLWRIGCHEVGHTVGMKHPDDLSASCVNENTFSIYYSQDHSTHVNDRY